MKKKSELAFDNYFSYYDKNEKQIRFKYYHSYRVEELMKELAIELKLSKEEIEIAQLIGLLHDIGRFEQIKKYGDCSDTLTGTDHADESCIYLFEEGHIRDFIEDNKYDEIIKDAIKNHNKLEIDKNLKGKNLLFTKMIRDMDKVDVYRVLSEEYKGYFSIKEISKKVYDSFINYKTIDSHFKKTETDEFIARLAFVFDINFKESIVILDKTNYFNDYLNTIEIENKNEKEFNDNNKMYLKLLNKVNNFKNKKKED